QGSRGGSGGATGGENHGVEAASRFPRASGEELVPELPPQQAARVPQLPSRRDARRGELVRRCAGRLGWQLDRRRIGEPPIRCVGEHVNEHQARRRGPEKHQSRALVDSPIPLCGEGRRRWY
ncbi:unnamed protein product, partial [Ectocarpus sp. 12 AP-2014]